jgi:hypothetical protein
MIRLVLPKDSSLNPTQTSNLISLAEGNTPIMSVGRDGKLVLAPGVTITPEMSSHLGLSLSLISQ